MRILVCSENLDYRDTEQEARLLELAQLGDQNALTSLMKMHARLITSTAKNFPAHSLSFAERESGAHEGFIRAVHKYQRQKGKFSDHAVSWMNACIRRLMHNEVRYQKKHPSLTTRYDDADEHQRPVTDTGNPPLDAALKQREQRLRLESLLACLSPFEQKIMKQHYGLPGPPLSLREIASENKTSSDAIKGIVGKALRKMKTRAKTTPSQNQS